MTLQRIGWRVVDALSGAEVIGDLPHLHQSTGEVRALQRGYSPAASLGIGRILLPPMKSDAYRTNRDTYAKLAIGQRLEGYVGVPTTGATPRYSAVITNVRRRLASPCEIEWTDSLLWLQRSQVMPGEVIAAPPASGLALVQRFSATMETQWDDSFAFWTAIGLPDSANYSVSGWSGLTPDPIFGIPSLTSTTISPTIGYVTTNSTWASTTGPFTWCYVRASGVIVGGTDANDAGELSVLLLSDATVQNGLMCRAVLLSLGAGLYNVAAQIYSIAAGVYTQRASALVFQGVSGTFLAQVTAVLYYANAQFNLRVLVNGKDPNVVYSGFTPPASGRIGLRMSAGTGGSPKVYCFGLAFRARTGSGSGGTNRFGQGTQSSGGNSVMQPITGNGQTHLEMLLLASTYDQFWIRKNAGRGYKADTIDYAASPGTDLSASIAFDEVAGNVEDATVETVAEIFTQDARVNGPPGGDSGGSVTWERIGAPGDMVLVDTTVDVGVPGFALLTGYAQQIQARKVNLLQATQLVVRRTGDTADKWRELDFVLVNIPSMEIIRQKMQIVGYTFDEASELQTIWLTQLPARKLAGGALGRVIRPLGWLTDTYAAR